MYICIVYLPICKDAFEKKFLVATDKLYAAEGTSLVNELDVPAYLLHVEKRLKVGKKIMIGSLGIKAIGYKAKLFFWVEIYI